MLARLVRASACVVSPRRLGVGGCKPSGEHPWLPRSAPLPPAEAPKASPAAPTSPEGIK